MMAWIRIFILTLHKLHALQPFLRGNVRFRWPFNVSFHLIEQFSVNSFYNVTVQMIPFKEKSLLELHVELRNFIKFDVFYL
ncbi:hypothetical protein TNCT_489651 [Trichonephila clavata]|uniref:Secreted protein n=1 Tax=Trichonephila clavata TaxID=2740835 RepID=A0A8X6LHL6_TRICU|nr:hypothetical protein TNCT_489651 [Trichonephila clavata]